METTATAYPLQWPAGWPRHKRPERSRFSGTPGKARNNMLREIERLGGTNIVISSDVALRLDGLPYAGRKAPDDQGVAVYFTRNKKPMTFASDRWETIAENMQAIGKTIEALRGIERWGASDMMERAFTGFVAITDQSSESWYAVLGVAPDATPAEVKAAYKFAVHTKHPDRHNGDSTLFIKVTNAYEEYKNFRGAQ